MPKSRQTGQFRVKTSNAIRGAQAPFEELSFFSKICRMVISPVRVTYNHAVVFFAQDRKTVFKLANRATFDIAKSLICFKFHTFRFKNIHF